jgi:uncharacterized protein (TIGR02271 family)
MASDDIDSGAESASRAGDLIRHEEELELGRTERVAGSLRVRKRVQRDTVGQDVDRQVERLDEVERVPARNGDSGEVETLADGSISIPIFEEELVVSKRVVVRERVVIRKRTGTETQRVEAELRRERVEVDADDDVDVVDPSGERANETHEG